LAVRIRLTRVGATKRPAYRVIAIDKRRSRDGRALEILGFYDPLTEPATVQLDTARIQAWIGKGAQPSDTVAKLMRQSEREAAAGAEADKAKRPTRATAPKKPSRKAQTKKAAAVEAEAAPAEAVEEAPAAETDGGTEAPAPEAAADAPASEAADESNAAEGEAKGEA
jgi:small subunit ribosomal protein S16